MLHSDERWVAEDILHFTQQGHQLRAHIHHTATGQGLGVGQAGTSDHLGLLGSAVVGQDLIQAGQVLEAHHRCRHGHSAHDRIFAGDFVISSSCAGK